VRNCCAAKTGRPTIWLQEYCINIQVF